MCRENEHHESYWNQMKTDKTSPTQRANTSNEYSSKEVNKRMLVFAAKNSTLESNERDLKRQEDESCNFDRLNTNEQTDDTDQDKIVWKQIVEQIRGIYR